MDIESIIDRIKKDEGFSPYAYWDREQWTYGYGCKAPDSGAFISEPAAAILLTDRVEYAIKDFADIYADCRGNINDVRSEALVNMCFNLGKTKLLKFRRMNQAIRNNDWFEAAHQASSSVWYVQVGNRAKRIVKELATGEVDV